MHIVNPSGVKFTNKYLTWFRCLGLEDHGLGEGTNGDKKAASNAKRYPLCENRRIPFTRNPPVSCLLGCCPNPRRTQNCVLERWINPSAARFFKSLMAGNSTLLPLFFPSFICFLLRLVQFQNTVDVGFGRQQFFHFLTGFSVLGIFYFCRYYNTPLRYNYFAARFFGLEKDEKPCQITENP